MTERENMLADIIINAGRISEQARTLMERYVKQNKELKHRADVAERQAILLSKWLAEKTRKDYPWQAWFDEAQKQAEKELAEEKDD